MKIHLPCGYQKHKVLVYTVETILIYRQVKNKLLIGFSVTLKHSVTQRAISHSLIMNTPLKEKLENVICLSVN